MSNQLARRDSDAAEIFTGTSRDADRVTKALQTAQEKYHLVSPAAACGRLPEGCGIALTTVAIDIPNETYDVGGKRGLSKTALDRIAAAAGISWDARQSGRLDDGSNPHYVMFRAVGVYRSFDGVEMQLVNTKEMDLREGSAQVQALRDRYESQLAKYRRGGSGAPRYEPKDPDPQIREMRLHILAHAETKARLRAIRSLGLRSAYTEAELKKPFVVARLMWTGESDDPELRRTFAVMQAQKMLGGVQALYGQVPTPAPLPTSLVAPARIAPPPVGSSRLDDDDIVEMPMPTSPEPAREAARVQAQERSQEQTTRQTQTPDVPVPVIGFGKHQGTPITDLSDRDLTWYASFFEKAAADPAKARYRDENAAMAEACRAEQARRAGDGDVDRGDDPESY